MGRRVVPTEREEVAAVFRWRDLWLSRIPDLRLLYASAQGEVYQRAHGRPQIAGLSPGIPDLHWPVPRNGFHGLWIEAKRLKGGCLSEEQRWWGDQLRAQGHFVVCARGADRIISWVLRYHAGTGLQLGDRDCA